MRYVVDIPPDLAEEINRQVASGRYKSPQDFILAAIQNQTYLETVESGSAATVSLGDSASPIVTHLQTVAAKTVGAKLLLALDPTRVKTVPLSGIPRSDYLWGQYNRIFPVKVITRVVSNLVSENGSNLIPLAELQEKSSEVARELGKVLQRKDKLMGRKRGKILSAGLPIGREVGKAVARFKNQFVGYLAKDWIEGAAPVLKFLDLVKDEHNSVMAGITDLGLKFSSLPNPIIDKEDYSVPFSEQETDFLLHHIATQLPGETKLIRLVLESINKGIATPDDLSVKIKSYNRNWTANEVVAMRVGVISRIVELGLLDRHKDGVRVTYVLTPRGNNFLSRLVDGGA